MLNPLGTGQGQRNLEFPRPCAGDQRMAARRNDPPDKRLKASIVVANEDGLRPPRNPRARRRQEFRPGAAAEPHCRAARPAPLLADLSRRRKRRACRSASTSSASAATPSRPSGWPSYYIEEMVGHSQCQRSALASLVLEGVFERFPKLKMVMIEAGFAWVPSLAWRLDKVWQRLRGEVPHLKRPPSEYIREQVWWTTQPMEDPEQREHLLDLIDWIGWDRLLFATDYPHWDFDDPSRVLPAGVSDAHREAFYLGNAKEL